MKTVLVNDTVYDAEGVRKHREHIIDLRNSALDNANFDWAVILSITIGLLHELSKTLEEPS